MKTHLDATDCRTTPESGAAGVLAGAALVADGADLTAAHWRSLLALSSDLVWETDAQHRVTSLLGRLASPSLLQRCLGHGLWTLWPVAAQQPPTDTLQAHMDRQHTLKPLDLMHVLPGGAVQWLRWQGLPCRDAQGGFLGYRGTAQDITELKKAQQAHQQHRQATALLFQRIPALVFQLRRSPGGWFSLPFISGMVRDVFGVDPDEARVDAACVLQRVLPVDYVRCRESLERSARNLQPWVESFRMRLSGDAGVRWLQSHAVPHADADGTVAWYGVANDVTDGMDADAQLQRAHEQLRLRTQLMEVTLGSLGHGVLMVSAEGRVTYYNQQLLELLHIPDGLLARQPLLSEVVEWQLANGYLTPDMVQGDLAALYQIDRHGVLDAPARYARQTHDGHTLDVRTRQLDGGGWVRTFADITDYFQSQAALARSELHLRALFEAIPDRVWLKDTAGAFIMANPTALDAFGQTLDAVVGRTEEDLVPGGLMPGHRDTDQRALNSHAPVVFEQTLPMRPGDAAIGVFDVVKRAVFDQHGNPMGVLGMARDVTERKRTEAQIERLAFYDPLTGLCNRRLFHERLAQAQTASSRHQEWGAVCFIDLDNFKDLNDTQGHDQGDVLLQHVGKRLREAVREQDTVARLGGDEFVVLLGQLGTDAPGAAIRANAIGEKLLQALTQPYPLRNGPHHNTPSIGITLFHNHDERVEDILKRADLAMYQSKSAGRNTVRFFDPQMQDMVLRRAELERDLREALALNQLSLYTQAVVDVQGRTLGFEALLRWRHAQRGMVSPAEFIPVAEQTSLILPIGEWVLRTACECLVRWAADPVSAQWTLAVNLSARQLRQPQFVEQVQQVLQDTGAPPSRLKLELTESLLLHDLEDTVTKMKALAQWGICFSLDDFGTGYSSLSYLKRLPLTVLKIDQSFVRDLLTDPNDAAIAHTILQLAQSLGLEVVAEGVETQGQKQLLEVMGCTAFQGYLFGRPAPM